jgi:NTE family protein
MPFGVVATDLGNGREVWLREGSLFKAVRASLALPGLLSPAYIDGRWLVDGGLVNPVPVSLCRALGAEVVIAVNLNGDIIGKREPRRRGRVGRRRRKTKPAKERAEPKSSTFLDRLSQELPSRWRNSTDRFVAQLLKGGRERPSYFDVMADSINIMQDHITRSRMAGDPPEILLAPRLSHIRLMEFNRADEAIAEGKACVERALPTIKDIMGDEA